MHKSRLLILVNIVSISTLLIISSNCYTSQTSNNDDDTIPINISSTDQISTDQYIANFKPRHYEIIGADYFNPRYSLNRLNKPIEQINITLDYPFEYLEEVSNRLVNVDRLSALKAIFSRITAGNKNNLERHLTVLKFLQRSSFHNYIQPMYSDGQAVFDPLILLEVGEMRCGAVSRVAVDLFQAAGYNARLVQGYAHTSAEIYYDNSWHLFEGDLGGGLPVIINGRIPSVQELSDHPYLMDKVPSRFEFTVGYKKTTPPGIYRSYYFFSKQNLRNTDAGYYYKTATDDQAKTSKWYGWNYYKSARRDWKLTAMSPFYEPAPVVFKSVIVDGDKTIIKWDSAIDYDNDILGYRVYVSKSSRGWNYRNNALTPTVSPYVVHDWKPEMYDSMYNTPPHDIGLFDVKSTEITLDLVKGDVLYVTVMAYDRHGESVNRHLYNMSPELYITNR